MFREEGKQVSLVIMSRLSLRTVAPPPCLPRDIKDSPKEDTRFSDGLLIGWLWAATRMILAAAAELCQRLARTWDSASLSTKTLRKLKRT
jgi:hypothetical protein